jgi:DNA polymerase III epsilon subunit-like protein
VSRSENSIPIYQKDLCFIDIETTGSQIGFHEIIEVGVIRTAPAADLVRLKWHKRIAPLHPERVTAFARELNGFCLEDWTKELPSRSFWEEFVAIVTGGVPVCHNPSFERAFISLCAAEYGVVELGVDHHWIGTESLAWPLVKFRSLTRYSLESICEHLGIAPEPRPHSAIAGADACLRAYKTLMQVHAAVLEGQPT